MKMTRLAEVSSALFRSSQDWKMAWMVATTQDRSLNGAEILLARLPQLPSENAVSEIASFGERSEAL